MQNIRLMKDESLCYKMRFITMALIFGYSYLHFRLTGLYTEATLNQFIDFSVRLPFSQRLLLPTIAHVTKQIVPIDTPQIFFLLEWLCVSLFYFSLKRLLRIEFSLQQAQALSWLFLLILPLVTVINYRYAFTGIAPLYFPNDSASLLFTAVGYFLCLQARWLYFIPWVFLATFNRESSFLLVFLLPALYWSNLRAIVKPMALSLLAFLLAHILVWLLVKHQPGHFFELYTLHNLTHLELNLLRLFPGCQLFYFIFCLAGLPFFWFTFYDYIPLRYRPLRYLTLLYFLSLLLVGNFIEARIFSEIVVLLYLPVCLGMKRWLSDEPRVSLSRETGISYYCDRYAVVMLLTLVVLLKESLNKIVIWFSHL